MLALVDCNSFYVSCEQVFNPKTWGKPVVVLSNNDGVIVSRSPEAKALGIPMGAPFFKVQALLEKHQVQVFSSNYALYGDLSDRVMTILGSFAPELEIYSIDEAFLDLSGFQHLDLTEYGLQIRKTVLQWTGIPVSIGIAPTKVLAKIASRVAKKSPEARGVFDLSTCDRIETVLAATPVEDIWGIGRRYSKWLRVHNITSALELRDASDDLIRKKMGVVGLRLLQELRGVSCLSLDLCPNPKHETCVSRSFGRPVESLQELQEAIATYTSRAAEKLRRQKQAATSMQIFARTSLFEEAEGVYSNSTYLTLPVATNITPQLLNVALRGAEALYRSGYRYKKAGVIMLGLVPENCIQGNLLEPVSDWQKDQSLMRVLDQINTRFGSGTLRYAPAGFKQGWKMSAAQHSPRYVTCWQELAIAKA